MELSMPDLLSTQQLELGKTSFDYTTFLLVFLLSSFVGYLLSRLYFLYFRENEPQDASLARSFVLITPALTTIFWLIQSQLTLSLGLLGSLAVIRFRTPVKRAEDIAFVLLSISFAIMLSLQVWFSAAIFTIAVFLFSYIRNAVNLKREKLGRFGIVTINTREVKETRVIQGFFQSENVRSDCVSVRAYDGITSYVFNVPSVKPDQQDRLITHMRDLDAQCQINFYYPNERMGA